MRNAGPVDARLRERSRSFKETKSDAMDRLKNIAATKIQDKYKRYRMKYGLQDPPERMDIEPDYSYVPATPDASDHLFQVTRGPKPYSFVRDEL